MNVCVCIVNGDIENYRSSLSDATEARKANPEHMKAIVRGTCTYCTFILFLNVILN